MMTNIGFVCSFSASEQYYSFMPKIDIPRVIFMQMIATIIVQPQLKFDEWVYNIHTDHYE